MGFGGRPRAFESPEALEKALQDYFVEKENSAVQVYNKKTGSFEEIKQQMPLHITGMCSFLGITRQTLNEYQKRPEFSDTIMRAKKKCEAYAVDMCFVSAKNKADFVLTNCYKEDWQQKQTVEHEISEKVADRLAKFLKEQGNNG